MALTETVLLYYLSRFGQIFVSSGIFKKEILFKRSGILEDIYLIILGKPEALQKETPAKDLALQKQPFQDVYKIGLLKHSLKLTVKHLYQSLYLMKY